MIVCSWCSWKEIHRFNIFCVYVKLLRHSLSIHCRTSYIKFDFFLLGFLLFDEMVWSSIMGCTELKIFRWFIKQHLRNFIIRIHIILKLTFSLFLNLLNFWYTLLTRLLLKVRIMKLKKVLNSFRRSIQGFSRNF